MEIVFGKEVIKEEKEVKKETEEEGESFVADVAFLNIAGGDRIKVRSEDATYSGYL